MTMLHVRRALIPVLMLALLHGAGLGRSGQGAPDRVHDQGAAAGRTGAAAGGRTSGSDGPVVAERRRAGGVGPLRRGSVGQTHFDPKVTPEEPPFRPVALAKIKSMTPVELELSKSSVNCIPRGLPEIWLGNPYTTVMVHKPDYSCSSTRS